MYSSSIVKNIKPIKHLIDFQAFGKSTNRLFKKGIYILLSNNEIQQCYFILAPFIVETIGKSDKTKTHVINFNMIPLSYYFDKNHMEFDNYVNILENSLKNMSWQKSFYIKSTAIINSGMLDNINSNDSIYFYIDNNPSAFFKNKKELIEDYEDYSFSEINNYNSKDKNYIYNIKNYTFVKK